MLLSPQSCSRVNVREYFVEAERGLGEVDVFIGHSMGGGTGSWSVREAGFRPDWNTRENRAQAQHGGRRQKAGDEPVAGNATGVLGVLLPGLPHEFAGENRELSVDLLQRQQRQSSNSAQGENEQEGALQTP